MAGHADSTGTRDTLMLKRPLTIQTTVKAFLVLTLTINQMSLWGCAHKFHLPPHDKMSHHLVFSAGNDTFNKQKKQQKNTLETSWRFFKASCEPEMNVCAQEGNLKVFFFLSSTATLLLSGSFRSDTCYIIYNRVIFLVQNKYNWLCFRLSWNLFRPENWDDVVKLL